MVRGTQAAVYTQLATVYTTLGIRARPTRPNRPTQAWLFVRPVESTELMSNTKKSRSILVEKQWKICINNKEIVLREQLDKIMNAIQLVKDLGLICY